MRRKIITFRDFVNHDKFADSITWGDENVRMDGYGNLIRAARIAAKLSQAKLQKLCGWGDGNSRISQYEKDIREPSFADLRRIAEVLQRDVRDFVPGGQSPSGHTARDDSAVVRAHGISERIEEYAVAGRLTEQQLKVLSDLVESLADRGGNEKTQRDAA